MLDQAEYHNINVCSVSVHSTSVSMPFCIYLFNFYHNNQYQAVHWMENPPDVLQGILNPRQSSARKPGHPPQGMGTRLEFTSIFLNRTRISRVQQWPSQSILLNAGSV